MAGSGRWRAAFELALKSGWNSNSWGVGRAFLAEESTGRSARGRNVPSVFWEPQRTSCGWGAWPLEGYRRWGGWRVGGEGTFGKACLVSLCSSSYYCLPKCVFLRFPFWSQCWPLRLRGACLPSYCRHLNSRSDLEESLICIPNILGSFMPPSGDLVLRTYALQVIFFPPFCSSLLFFK